MTTTTKEIPIFIGTIQNTCTCSYFDEDTESYVASDDCYGDCWTYAMDDFAMVTKKLRDNNDTDWWQCKGLRLWDGEVGGLFPAKNIRELIQGMTVNSEWTMSYKIFEDRIEYSLSHHDAPMGSNSTLRAVTEEQREEWGLY